jgi:hypothetical protein
MRKSTGNDSGQLKIAQRDMGGWVRVWLDSGEPSEKLPVFLSHALTDWFRQHPQYHMRTVVPIQRDGDTVELHAWFDVGVVPDLTGGQPT